MLGGCGGSSSSSSSGPAPLPQVTINSTNASTVTGAAIGAATLKPNSLSPLGVQTSGSQTSDRLLYSVNDFAIKKIAELQNAPLSITGTTTQYACPTSGSFTFNTDGSSASTSTYATLTFNNCQTSTTSTINGTFSVTGMAVTATTQAATVSINITIAITGSATYKYVGGYHLSATGVTTASRTDALTGTSLVFSVNTTNESLSNFSFSSSYANNATPVSFSDTVNYTISSDFTGGSFTLSTISPIVTNYGQAYPKSGQVVVYGANSTALRITVVSSDTNAGTASGTVTLELSTNNGSSWTLLSTKMWSQL